MWNWGSHGMEHCGQVIAVNPQSSEAASQLGWQTAPTVEEAIQMGRSKHGLSATVTIVHTPPIAMWDVK